MSLDPIGGRRPHSPTNSGRSSPAPRFARRAVEDGTYKVDKPLRRYGATIERVLASWEVSPQEWADYIAFLSRLLKAIQAHPKDVSLLPHSAEVASKLSQCLNPALPSGVHQKALDVYGYIFTTFGLGYIAGHLHELLPGLSGVLSFASLAVRPAIYSLYEDWIVHLPATELRPVLRSLTLSLLPAIEEETSEDFDQAFRIIERLELTFSPENGDRLSSAEINGYFWQCLFLAVITCPSRRQGALNYLARKLPKFESSSAQPLPTGTPQRNGAPTSLSPEARAVISPEPGLLIRCFVCGLSDAQILVQRGFLDIVVTHLPLHSPLLQEIVGHSDLDRLISAAINVLLRRDMSLNRRLWSWFLGPSSKRSNAAQELSENTDRQHSADGKPDAHFQYFSKYGRKSLERCVLRLFGSEISSAAERARPFRVCLSLMDRWEIGGSIVPHIFLPALESAYTYILQASSAEAAEVMRSASLFFDGVEANLIWAKLLDLLQNSFTESAGREDLQQLTWILQHFNIRDEEMLVTHIPHAIVYALLLLRKSLHTATSDDRSANVLDVVAALLNKVPDRAFGNKGPEKAKKHSIPFSDIEDIEMSIKRFYHTNEDSARSEAPISGVLAFQLLYELITSLSCDTLEHQYHGTFSQAVSLLLTLQKKAPESAGSRTDRLLPAMEHILESASAEGRTLEFTTISSILALVSALNSGHDGHVSLPKPKVERVGSLLAAQLWNKLSPGSPKYHVEAVRAVWQLQDVLATEGGLQASLCALLRASKGSHSQDGSDCIESFGRFTVIWGHTVPAPASATKAGSFSTARRGSVMASLLDTKHALERQKILTQPLMLVLDLLTDRHEAISDVVKSWLMDLPTLEQVLDIHFELLDNLIGSLNKFMGASNGPQRRQQEIMREVSYVFDHILQFVKSGREWIWRCMSSITCRAAEGETELNGNVALAQYCCRFICNDPFTTHGLDRKAMELLGILLTGPSAVSLKTLDLDEFLIARLMDAVPRGGYDHEGTLLELVTTSLKLRLAEGGSDYNDSSLQKGSSNSKRPSTSDVWPSSNASKALLLPTPPAQLLKCLQLGLSSTSSRRNREKWVEFLSEILPMFSDAIFAQLLPLVECICNELGKLHNEVVSTSKVDAPKTSFVSETTLLALFEALEMTLARAHECLTQEQDAGPIPRPASQQRGLFGNMAPGGFKANGPPSKTAHANSRLTVILAFQDAIRVALGMWIWATHHSDVHDFDKSSAATTAHTSLRVRNRSRQLMEQLFDVEPLECLEVVISNWCTAIDSTKSDASMSLLHVVQSLRPKSIVPTILDALCSRVNAAALATNRQSCQAIDLDPLDISAFLSAYLQSIEDDAMDEIWADSIAFLKDVLANPLPYRQILPAFLHIILLLAQKADNTNFGEQRKMRRELGDLFLRLLTATFTTMPSSHIVEPKASDRKRSTQGASDSAFRRRDLSLVVVLEEVTENIETILETADRTATAINSITTNLLGPLFHSKSFPANISSDVLSLLLQMCKKAPLLRPWKKELSAAFDDARILTTSVEQMEQSWFPVLQQWSLHDKERMLELLSRLTAPSSAGIMFGVGATAARLEADRKTQLNLRRICILLLACPQDNFVADLRALEERLVELFVATSSSSPSCAVKAELFMVCRTLVLATSAIQLAPMWPIINDNLQMALSSLLPNASNSGALENLALLQACKLLDLLVVVSPDEFQPHEWLYITDTIDAVYRPSEGTSIALADHIAEALASDSIEGETKLLPVAPTSSVATSRRRPLISNDVVSDVEDIKAMVRDDFARAVLRPFLSQLSINAYEGVYSMDIPDLQLCKRLLLEDLLEITTIVD